MEGRHGGTAPTDFDGGGFYANIINIVTLIKTMLTIYINQAMKKAIYELLENGTFYGEIPECQGVWANTNTLESCRQELQEILEGWLILGLRLGHTLPIIDNININISEEVA